MILFQSHTDVDHLLIIVFWRFLRSLLKPTKLGIEIPEGYRCSLYHVHLFKDLFGCQVTFLFTGLVVSLSFDFQGGEHHIFNFLSGILLCYEFLYFPSPNGIHQHPFIGGLPEEWQYYLATSLVFLLLSISLTTCLLVTMFLILAFPVSILSITALGMVSIMMRCCCSCGEISCRVSTGTLQPLTLILKLERFLGRMVVLWTPNCLLCKVPVNPSSVAPAPCYWYWSPGILNDWALPSTAANHPRIRTWQHSLVLARLILDCFIVHWPATTVTYMPPQS